MLTDSKVKTLKPADIRKRYADADGLYLEVFTNGTKIWEYRYTLNGKRKMMSIGEYPMVGIREARELRDQARRRLFDGEPAKESPAESAHVFQAVAEQWRENNNIRWTEKTRDITRRRLEMYILPFLGDRELAEIKPAEILSLARRLEAKDEPETAHRIVQLCGQIFQYAVACGYCEFDPTQSIRRALVPVKVKHFASLTAPPDVAALMRAVDAYPQPVVRMAMRFSALTFVRPGEVRHAEWAEIHDGEWRIPDEKMKMKKTHIVPLARQTLELLDELRAFTGHGKYIFPSNRAPRGDRPMSENTVLAALRSMGYTKDQMTPHGFRSIAETLLNENGFNRDWIERQCAHSERNSVRAAYNYAEYLPERRRMMQWWADYLDELRQKA